jgi:hypothetical protein
MKSPKPPKRSSGKTFLLPLLAVLGQIGLIGSSMYLVILVLFPSRFNPSMPVRDAGIFVVSASFFLISSYMGGGLRLLLENLKWMALVVPYIACLGLLAVLVSLYSHRQPHQLSHSEWSWAVIDLVALTFLFWRLHLYKKQPASDLDTFIPKNLAQSSARVLKPGSRAAIALGIVFGIVALVAALPMLTADRILDGLKAAGAMLVLYGVIIGWIYGQRIIVGCDFIAFKTLGCRSRAIHFKDITRSHCLILAEKEHPVALDIYGRNHHRPALSIRLKPFSQADVKWLLSLPELRL